MELGDLQKATLVCDTPKFSRNPRYNGIGWFTSLLLTSKAHFCLGRNPRYNGIGWFTVGGFRRNHLAVGRNPRYNGIGWFTIYKALSDYVNGTSQSSL